MRYCEYLKCSEVCDTDDARKCREHSMRLMDLTPDILQTALVFLTIAELERFAVTSTRSETVAGSNIIWSRFLYCTHKRKPARDVFYACNMPGYVKPAWLVHDTESVRFLLNSHIGKYCIPYSILHELQRE